MDNIFYTILIAMFLLSIVDFRLDRVERDIEHIEKSVKNLHVVCYNNLEDA